MTNRQLKIVERLARPGKPKCWQVRDGRAVVAEFKTLAKACSHVRKAQGW